MSIKVPYFKQEREYTCGPACLRMVLAYYGIQFAEEQLIEECKALELGTTCSEIAEAAENLGFEAEVFEGITKEQLIDLIKEGLPVILLLDPAVLYEGIGGLAHFVVLIGITRNYALYHDPEVGESLKVRFSRFEEACRACDLMGVKIWKRTKR